MPSRSPRPPKPGVTSVRLYFLPVRTRLPWKFGNEILTEVTCARVRIGLTDPATGRSAEGWGETPLSVQWVWPSDRTPYAHRHDALIRFTTILAGAWADFKMHGHAIEIGHEFIEDELPVRLDNYNYGPNAGKEKVPHLAALVCCSPFDQRLHYLRGKLVGLPVYQTYNSTFMARDLASYLEPAEDAEIDFTGKHPEDFW
ncbi:MAG: hypothetical protein R3C45_11915 [Phycisphaerales bacterium]